MVFGAESEFRIEKNEIFIPNYEINKKFLNNFENYNKKFANKIIPEMYKKTILINTQNGKLYTYYPGVHYTIMKKSSLQLKCYENKFSCYFFMRIIICLL